jgi:hypothetical protein
MQVRTHLSCSLAALLLVAVLGCGTKDAPYKYTVSGNRGQSDGLLISGGNLMVHEGMPGVFFGTVKTPGGTEQFSYFVVFKHGIVQSDGASVSQDGNASCNGREGSSDHTVVLNGKTIQAKHEIQLDDMSKVAKEVLEIGGKVVDVKAGRLFLIDLTAASPTYDQRDVEISVDIPALESPEDVETLAGQALESLKSEIPDEFLK